MPRLLTDGRPRKDRIVARRCTIIGTFGRIRHVSPLNQLEMGDPGAELD